jgi:AcrR family transcriptional regulator
MGRLAARVGVAKATLYRWTGSREQLIGEVISYLSDLSFERALAATTELDGVERVMAVYRHNVATIVAFEPLRRFVRSETPLAIRVLTLRGSVVEATVSRQIAQLLEQELRRGSMTLRAPAGDLAYAIVKVTEGFIYADPVAEIEPDIDAASGIIRLLLE